MPGRSSSHLPQHDSASRFPLSLEDRSKPGHRKILALFLVDPHRRIISSANVPLHRPDWASESRILGQKAASERLPDELQGWVWGLVGSADDDGGGENSETCLHERARPRK